MLLFFFSCVSTDKIVVDGSSLAGGAWSTSIQVDTDSWACSTEIPGTWTASGQEGVCTLLDPEAAGFEGLSTYATINSTSAGSSAAPVPDYVTWWSENYLDDFCSDCVWWDAHEVGASAARSTGSWSYTFDVLEETGNPEAVYSIYPDISLALSCTGDCASFWTPGDGYAPIEFTVGFTGGATRSARGSRDSACTGGSTGSEVALLVPREWHGLSTRGSVEMVPILVSGTQKPADAWVTRITPSTLGDLRTLYTVPAGSDFLWSTATLTTTGLTSLSRGRATRFTSGTQLGARFATTTALTAGRSYQFPQVTIEWACPRLNTAAEVPQDAGYTLEGADLGLGIGQEFIVRPRWSAGWLLVELAGLPLEAETLHCAEGPVSAGDTCTVELSGYGLSASAEVYASGSDLVVDLSDVSTAGGRLASATSLLLPAR